MKGWKNKFDNSLVTLPEINDYINCHKKLSELCSCFHVKCYLIDYDEVSYYKQSYEETLSQLKSALIKSVDYPKMKNSSCLLSAVLIQHGIFLPNEILTFVSNHVKLLGCDVIQHEFYPECQYSNIIIDDTVPLSTLTEILNNLNSFVEPFSSHIEVLLFFKFHHSFFFDKYVCHHLRQLRAGHSDSQTFLDDFGKALSLSKKRLSEILKGHAVYNEVIAEDESILKNINIDHEFAVLKSYAKFFKITYGNKIDGTQAIIELVQLMTHVNSLSHVCKQYLPNCFKDESVQKLCAILEDTKVRSELKAEFARDKVNLVRKLLLFEDHTDPRCLEIFAEISNSEDFYKFIQAHNFYGKDGCLLFKQQYDLITVQLQHEEYDESVLHHLKVAFNYMTIFMDSSINFETLMTKVMNLDATQGFKQLSTVKSAMTLISLWFSKAEV